MLSPDRLQTFAQWAGEATLQAELSLKTLNTNIAALEADGGLAKEQRDFKIRASRNQTTTGMTAHVSTVREIAAQVASERPRWESIPFVLSQQKFSEYPSSHAEIAAWHASRLAKLPAPLLALEFADAKATSNWALAGLILAERAGRVDPRQAGEARDFALDEDAIPGRKTALSSISAIESHRIDAERMFGEANGRKSGIDRLHAARARRDAEAA
jgi:hypothetical protein